VAFYAGARSTTLYHRYNPRKAAWEALSTLNGRAVRRPESFPRSLTPEQVLHLLRPLTKGPKDSLTYKAASEVPFIP
jgi:hypothetical protein